MKYQDSTRIPREYAVLQVKLHIKGGIAAIIGKLRHPSNPAAAIKHVYARTRASAFCERSRNILNIKYVRASCVVYIFYTSA